MGIAERDTTAIDMKMYVPDGPFLTLPKIILLNAIRTAYGLTAGAQGPEPDMDEFKLFDLGQKTLVFEPIDALPIPVLHNGKTNLPTRIRTNLFRIRGRLLTSCERMKRTVSPSFCRNMG